MSDHGQGAGASPQWTPVRRLSELARSLLSDDLGGRDAVPAHVAERVTTLAAQWTEHGFTARTVRPWADLTPECAAYLASRGVDPGALDQLIDTGTSRRPLTVRNAISTAQIDVKQAYDFLVAQGYHKPPAAGQPAPEPAGQEPAQAQSVPAPLVFSHPLADRAEQRGTAVRPTHTPFRT